MAVFLCILLVNVISLTIVAGNNYFPITSTLWSYLYILIASCAGSTIPTPATDSSSKIIVGGFETTIEENPWQAVLLLYSSLRCGGEIISDRWILSAAHCTMWIFFFDVSKFILLIQVLRLSNLQRIFAGRFECSCWFFFLRKQRHRYQSEAYDWAWKI